MLLSQPYTSHLFPDNEPLGPLRFLLAGYVLSLLQSWVL